MRPILVFGSVLLMIAAAGCAGTPVRVDDFSGAMRAEQGVGAQDVSRAALRLELTRDARMKASMLLEKGEAPLDGPMLTPADADASPDASLASDRAAKQEVAKAVEPDRPARPQNQTRNLP